MTLPPSSPATPANPDNLREATSIAVKLINAEVHTQEATHLVYARIIAAALQAKDDELRDVRSALTASQSIIKQLSARVEPVKPIAALTANDIYYLKSIKSSLDELKRFEEMLVELKGYGVANDAHADDRNWLDCFIDMHERNSSSVADDLFKKIEHGDAAHRQWLKDELDAYFAKVHMAEPVNARMREVLTEAAEYLRWLHAWTITGSKEHLLHNRITQALAATGEDHHDK